VSRILLAARLSRAQGGEIKLSRIWEELFTFFELVDHGLQRPGLRCPRSLSALRRQQPQAWRVEFDITLAVDDAKEVGGTRERRGAQLLAARQVVRIGYLERDHKSAISVHSLSAGRRFQTVKC